MGRIPPQEIIEFIHQAPKVVSVRRSEHSATIVNQNGLWRLLNISVTFAPVNGDSNLISNADKPPVSRTTQPVAQHRPVMDNLVVADVVKNWENQLSIGSLKAEEAVKFPHGPELAQVCWT